MGAEGNRRGGAGRSRRGAAQRLPRRARGRLRRGVLDRSDRAHRGGQLPVVLRLPEVQAAHRRLAAQPLHHPAGQPDRPQRGRVHRPLRLPRRGADRFGPHHHGGAEHRPGGGARGEPAPPLRADAAGLVPQSRRALGRGGRRGRAAHREGVGAVHGRVAAGLRDQCGSAAPGSGRQARTRRVATAVCRCARGGTPDAQPSMRRAPSSLCNSSRATSSGSRRGAASSSRPTSAIMLSSSAR